MALRDMWSVNENELLLDNYKPGSINASLDMQKLLAENGYNRTVDAIETHYRKIKTGKYKFKRVIDPEKREYIRRMAGRKPLREIAESIGLPMLKVKHHCSRYGISMAKSDDILSMSDVSMAFGVSYKWVKRRVESGAIKVARKDKQPGEEYWFREDDIKNFILTCPMELQDIIDRAIKPECKSPDMLWILSIVAGGLKDQHNKCNNYSERYAL